MPVMDRHYPETRKEVIQPTSKTESLEQARASGQFTAFYCGVVDSRPSPS